MPLIKHIYKQAYNLYKNKYMENEGPEGVHRDVRTELPRAIDTSIHYQFKVSRFFLFEFVDWRVLLTIQTQSQRDCICSNVDELSNAERSWNLSSILQQKLARSVAINDICIYSFA